MRRMDICILAALGTAGLCASLDAQNSALLSAATMACSSLSGGCPGDDDCDGWSNADELLCGTDTQNDIDFPVDSDGDGTCDANDLCPGDPNKTNPGWCGCGTPDLDGNNNTWPDCLEFVGPDGKIWIILEGLDPAIAAGLATAGDELRFGAGVFPDPRVEFGGGGLTMSGTRDPDSNEPLTRFEISGPDAGIRMTGGDVGDGSAENIVRDIEFVGGDGFTGRALEAIGVDAVIEGCSFDDFASEEPGAAVRGFDSRMMFINCRFTSNKSLDSGAALYAEFSEDLSLIKSTFENNGSINEGGAVFLRSSTAHVEKTMFSGNLSDTGSAGGMYADEKSFVTFIGSALCGNVPENLAVENSESIGDNCLDASSCADADGDGWPDECQCPGDFDGDGAVGGSDLSQILGAWGSSDSSQDLDGDGSVGGSDLAILLGAWGSCSDQ